MRRECENACLALENLDADQTATATLWIFPCRSGFLDLGYLENAHRVVAADRHIFPGHEAFFAKPEADLIVIIALNVVEISLPAGFAAQMSDAVFLVWPKASDTATRLVRLPVGGIETAFRIQWNQQVVTVFAVPFGTAFCARQHQANFLRNWIRSHSQRPSCFLSRTMSGRCKMLSSGLTRRP